MGYTNYFYTSKEINKSNWKAFIVKAKLLLANEESFIEDESNNNMVFFNGKAGGETMVLERVCTDEFSVQRANQSYDRKCFNFCKTNQRAYDKHVVATLLLAKLMLFDDIRISSDGNVTDWEAGRMFLNKKLGMNVVINTMDGEIEHATIEEAFEVKA